MTMTAAPALATATDGYDWRLSRLFMLRVAGLPVDAVEALRFTDAAGWAREVLALEEAAADTGRALADALEAAVGRETDDARRRLLISVRRDVFNQRPVRSPAALAAAATALGAADAEALHRFADQHRRHAELLASAADRLAAEVVERRQELRRLGQEPDLRRGIQLSSPSLDQYADGYLHGPPGDLPKRARRIERSVLEYLFRTACKTSPFSTLTAVCVGEFGEAPGRSLAVALTAEGKRSGTRLNMAVLARLSAMAQADPAVRAELRVRATGGWRQHEDLVRYLRRSTPHQGDADAAAVVDQLHESLFFLPAGQALAEILREVAGDRPPRVRDVVDRLAAVPGRDRDDADRYVAHLLRLGLLETPDLRINIHDPDPLATYRGALAGLEQPWADALAGRLGRVERAVAEFGTAGVADRRRLLGEVRDEVAAAHAELGHADAPVPATLVYEDTALFTRSVVADTAVWEERLLPDLRQLSRVMPAFDSSVVRRLVTRGYFHIRYGASGRCDDFLAFAHEFHRDFFDNFSQRLMRHRRFGADGRFTAYDNWFRQPELAAVDAARQVAAEHLRTAYAALPPGSPELVLGPEFVAEVTGALPDNVGALQPRSFFLQLVDDGRAPARVVVNRVYSGLTLLFSRFAHLFPGAATGTATATGNGPGVGGADLAAGLRDVLRGAQPSGAVFAELKGGYDATNLNLHPQVTAYEIVCPGETSDRPAAEQIPVDDLIVVDDPVRDRLMLRSRRLDVEVIPVYLGFLLPGALPEIQQVLLNFSYTGMAQLDLWAGTGLPAPGGDVVTLPRIRYGEVVLQRRQWRAGTEQIPRQRAGVGDAEWFLAWQRWRRDHGVPRRVFLTTDATAPAPAAPGDPAAGRGAGGRPRAEYKPLYVDLDSYFCLQMVDAIARDTAAVLVFTEMLPDPEQLPVRLAGQRYVTELTVEIDGVRREEP